MRYSLAFVALAAAVTAQSSSYPSGYVNPFTQYLTETDSRGVVTGMPQVNTDVNTNVATSEPLAVTTQPAVVTSQPAVATSPAGTPSIIPTLSTHLATGSSGNGTTGKNNTVSTGSLKSTGSKASSTAATTTPSNVGGSGSSSGTATAGSSSSSSTGKSSAGMLEPRFGLGLAGALLAAFL